MKITTHPKTSAQVKTWNQNGSFYSVLFVNNGEDATNLHKTHSTEKGAEKWANKVLTVHAG